MAKKTTKKIGERPLTPEAQREFDREKGGLVPEMSDQLALIYAKLLSVGCPPVRGVFYCAPQLMETQDGRDIAKKVASRWLNDAAVAQAIENINGGKFHELPLEERMKLALDKSNAEAAFYLWTINFGETEHREGIDKIKLARDIIKRELDMQPDEADPMQAFARMAMELAKNAQLDSAARARKAPQQQASSLERLVHALPQGDS